MAFPREFCHAAPRVRSQSENSFLSWRPTQSRRKVWLDRRRSPDNLCPQHRIFQRVLPQPKRGEVVGTPLAVTVIDPVDRQLSPIRFALANRAGMHLFQISRVRQTHFSFGGNRRYFFVRVAHHVGLQRKQDDGFAEFHMNIKWLARVFRGQRSDFPTLWAVFKRNRSLPVVHDKNCSRSAVDGPHGNCHQEPCTDFSRSSYFFSSSAFPVRLFSCIR